VKKNILEIFKYGISGTITTLINLYLFKIFVNFEINYILASVVSYIISVVISYFLNQRYVFLDSARGNTLKAKKQFLKFLIMRMLLLLIDTVLFFIIVSILKFPIYWSRLILTIIMISVTFVLNKWFIFVNK
jgi:gtrA family protein